jgi:hypothetical protein
MPITQARMQDIVREAQDVRDRANNLRADLCEALARGDYGAISLSIKAFELPLTPALAREQNHFARAGRKNERNARNMAAKRAGRNEATEGGTSDGQV